MDRLAQTIDRLVAFAERRFAVIVALVVIVAALTRLPPLVFAHGNGGDCVRYITWAKKLATDGLSSYPSLLTEYNQRWVGFSTPLRFAWLGTIAAVLKVWTAPPDRFHPILVVTWFGATLSFVPLALWLRRVTTMRVTLLTLLLCVSAPLLIGMARVPLPDAYHLVFLLTACALAGLLRDATGTRRTLLGLAMILDVIGVIGTRETGVIALVAVAFLPTFEAGWKPRADVPLLLCLTIGGLLTLALWVACAGGAGPLVEHIAAITRGAANTGNMAMVSGPYYRYFVDFTIVDPWVVIVALVALVPLLGSSMAPLVRLFGGSALLMVALFCLLPKSLRYVLFCDIGLRVLCAGAIVLLAANTQRRSRALVVYLLLLGHDVGLFFALYHKQQSYDPTTHGLARPLHMIP